MPNAALLALLLLRGEAFAVEKRADVRPTSPAAPAAAVPAVPGLSVPAASAAPGADAAAAAAAAATASPAAAAPAGALDDQALAAFIEGRSREERRKRLDLFLRKMRKSAASDFAFFRGMPDLFYDLLARSPEAAALRSSPELLLDGDGHAENVEIVEYKDKRLPQFNDFDDSDRGPAALDMARTLGGAAALGHCDQSRRELAEEAKKAYLESLKLPFADWRKQVAEEAAVKTGPTSERHWRTHGGKPLDEKDLKAKLFQLSALNPDNWAVLDRAGAGLSSIGVRRYLFAHLKKDHARELKQLRAPAVAVFTGKTAPKQGPRVSEAYARLRQVPVEVSTVSGLAAEWILRRREGTQTALNLEHPRSTARVLGGLLAQIHREQADVQALAKAMRGVEAAAVARWLTEMARMREGLARLLAAGRWDRG